MAILNRFSAILLAAIRLELINASRCKISGDSRPAILGIAPFAIRDSVPLRSWLLTVNWLGLKSFGEIKAFTSTVAALFSKMALTGQSIAMVDMVLLVLLLAFPCLS